MNAFTESFSTEFRKASRSVIFRITLILFAFVGAMMGFLVYIANHPELVGSSAVLSAKTAMIGNSDWSSYLELLYEVIAAIGMVGFGFVISWIFGREYADHTIKDILAIPVSRHLIVLSKLTVAVLWSLLLSALLIFAAIGTGLAVHIPGWSAGLARHGLAVLSVTALLTLAVSTPVAFFASYGRGYMLPMGFVLMLMILTQFIGLGIPGLAVYVPWAVPALYAGAAGPDGPQVLAASYIILAFTGVLGIILTMGWWRYADQK